MDRFVIRKRGGYRYIIDTAVTCLEYGPFLTLFGAKRYLRKAPLYGKEPDQDSSEHHP